MQYNFNPKKANIRKKGCKMRVGKKFFISLATVSLLSGQSEVTSLFSQWNNADKKLMVTKAKQTMNLKEYNLLCESVCETLSQICHQFCGYKDILDDESKKIAGIYLEAVNMVATEAKKRFVKFNNTYDEKVLYLALSTAHIIKAVLDDEFMAEFKGYKKSEDLFEFGKILDENRDADHYDTAFWADIRPISNQEADMIRKELVEKGIA